MANKKKAIKQTKHKLHTICKNWCHVFVGILCQCIEI